ncbi:MAG: glycosyltransferase [Coraliomargarita sp.]|nr:glycosyltransferase [Coraliomargarita sp.]
MHATEHSIVLVTPVWMDSQRLVRFGPQLAIALKESGLPVRWIVSDDGSGAEEQARVATLVESLQEIYPDVEALLLPDRSRKGGAIYRAWAKCEGADWLAFVDADGAVDADGVPKLINRAVELGKDAGCIAIRRDSAETPVQRDSGRMVSFWAFSTLVRQLVGIQFLDTQCGAKVVPARVYFQAAELLKERGFVFDVELLLVLERFGAQVDELAVPWSEVSGSRMHPWRDCWGMIAGLLRIRKRDRRGHYGGR